MFGIRYARTNESAMPVVPSSRVKPLITDVSENSTDKRDDANDGGGLENLPLVGVNLGQKVEAPIQSLSPIKV